MMSTGHVHPAIAFYRTAAVVAWAGAVMLFVIGINLAPAAKLASEMGTADPPADSLDCYAASCLTMLIAMSLSWRVVIGRLIADTVAKEVGVSRALLAGAVAEALADELLERGLVTHDRDSAGTSVTLLR